MMYYVYVLRCSDDSLYTGITPDLERRMRQHLGLVKGGARYTKLRPPKEMAALWTVPDKSAAAKAEYAIKHLTREDKQRLVNDPHAAEEILAREEPLPMTVHSILDLNTITE